MKWIALIVLACVAAGPATKPTTEDLQTQLADARHAVDRARAAAIDRCHETPEYKSAAADRDAKAKALENARASGSPQGRLDASSAFVKADQAVKRIEAEAVAKDAVLGVALAEENDAERKLDRVNELEREKELQAAREAKEKADAIANDPIHVAIRQHKIVKGMTLDQAHEAFVAWNATSYYSHFYGNRTVTDNSTREDGTEVVRWRYMTPSEYTGMFMARSVTVEVRDGKVVAVEEVNNNPR